MSDASKRFLIMAGGTGGHVFPGLAVAKELIGKGHSVFWMGTRAGIESELVPAAGISIAYVDIQGVRGKGKKGLLEAPGKINKAVKESKKIIQECKPDCILGMGGFVSGPGGVAAKLLGVPLVIHEQNAIPGTTNRILSLFANRVLEAFSGTFAKRINAVHVGNPVRKDLHSATHQIDHSADLKLLVLGGSLGAKAINDVIPEMVDTLDFTIDVWHQTGKKHIDEVTALYGEEALTMKSIELSPFIDDMAEAYAWADLVICRSGAMTVSELTVAGVPAIFIPYPHAIDDHQTANANWMASHQAAVVLPQSELTVSALRHHMKRFNKRRELLDQMRGKAKSLGMHDATENVVQTCLRFAK